MRNLSESIFLSVSVLLFWITLLPSTSFSQDENPLQIRSAEAVPYRAGNYRIILVLNQGRSVPPDTYFEDNLKKPGNYFLKEKTTEREIKLPAVTVSINMDDLYQIMFVDVDITHKKEYTVGFRAPLPGVAAKDLLFLHKEEAEKWEKRKARPWQRSIIPKIAQGDSTIREWGDLGIELFLSKELPKSFRLSLDASLTANKDDPNNHWKLDFYWQTGLWFPSNRLVLRPLTVILEEQATQGLTLHDLSVRAFTSISVHPFDGIQPIFMTAGWDHSKRIPKHGKDYDDPRVHLQAQWGFVGLVGRGSSFFIDYQYWRRVEDISNFDQIDPSQKRKREYIELEFTLPIAENKNITVRYADGDIAPTFTKDTSVHIGLEFLFGEYRVLVPK